MTSNDPIFSINASPAKINEIENHEQQGWQLMNASLLTNLMQLAMQQTGADRAVACDNNLAVIAAVNLDQEELLAEQLTNLLRVAIAKGEAVVANNAVKEAADAPHTKTSYDNLRGIVIIPVPGQGAVYLDRPLKQGIIAKSVVNKLVKLARQSAQNNQTEPTESQLKEMYQQIS
ncbi:MAG: hypothetical protein R3E39_13090 [Anaerolineae bacterium]